MKGIEVMVPNDCYYIGLSKLNNEVCQNHELRACLDDTQGQWITKIEDNKYIGINSRGILKLTLNEWFKLYETSVKNKLSQIIEKGNSDVKSILANLLSINISKNGISIDLIQYGMLGEPILVSNYNHK